MRANSPNSAVPLYGAALMLAGHLTILRISALHHESLIVLLSANGGGPSASPLATPLNVHCFTFVTWQCSSHFRNTFKNVFEESYLGLTKSHAIDRLSLGDRPVDRDRLVGHPCSRPMRCFPKFYSWDCFVKLHYEVIIFY